MHIENSKIDPNEVHQRKETNTKEKYKKVLSSDIILLLIVILVSIPPLRFVIVEIAYILWWNLIFLLLSWFMTPQRLYKLLIHK